MHKTLLISGIACTVLLLYAPIDTFLLQEYHVHQKAYRDMQVELAETDDERDEARRFPIRIRQIVLPELQRVDRCISCHIAMEDPMTVAAENPIKSHPGDYLTNHDVQKIGCTVCHDGQGRALNVRDAHALSIPDWEKPILHPPFIQANCMRCHEVGELEGLDLAKRGYDIFTTSGCLGCHRLEGKGGQQAPDLTHIADANTHLKRPTDHISEGVLELFHGNVNLAYIFESIREPRAQPMDSVMLDFDFPAEDIVALTIFLKGLSKRELPASYVVTRLARQHREENLDGRRLFAKYCVACHGEGGTGGVVNPNYAKDQIPALNTLAEKMFIEYEEDAEYLAELLVDGVDIENMSPPLDIEGRARVLAQYRAVKDVIKKGSVAAKAEPEGPAAALNMPSWKSGGLGDADIHSILAYLVVQFPWEEEYDEESEETEEETDP